MHYVSKCSGKYSQNVAASRYVHQMADEVINQLAGVAADIKKHVDEPEVLQKLLDDWNESFPPALGELGTPKAIALKLEKQHREIEDMKQTMEQERLGYEADITGILHSVDSQLEASRKGVLSERRQLARKTQFTVDIHKKEMEDLKNQFEEEKRKLKEELGHDAYVMGLEHSKAIALLKAEHTAALEEEKKKYKELSALLAKEKANHSRSKAHLSQKLQHIEEKYQSLRAGYGQFESESGVASTVNSSTVDSESFSVAGEDDEGKQSNDNAKAKRLQGGHNAPSSVGTQQYTKPRNGSTSNANSVPEGVAAGFNHTIIKKMKKVSVVFSCTALHNAYVWFHYGCLFL